MQTEDEKEIQKIQQDQSAVLGDSRDEAEYGRWPQSIWYSVYTLTEGYV